MDNYLWSRRIEDVLLKIQQSNLVRAHTVRTPHPSNLSKIDGDVTSFASNDYLGIAGHPEIKLAISNTASEFGTGPRSSALVSGCTHLHSELETRLARLTAKESALLFPTGYAANMSTLSCLTEGGGVTIFSDELNHASIIDGCRLAARNGAIVSIYKHCDTNHLESLLINSDSKFKIVITESLFSMDGDVADLQGIARLKVKFGFLLLVDEAHAMLVVGETGGGFAQEYGVQDRVDVVVGTLSKAFGCHGGFIGCSRAIRTLVSSRGRGHIFSTSLPMPIVAGALKAIDIAETESWRRKHLKQLINRVALPLGLPSSTWIIPVILGSVENTIRVSQALRSKGLYVPAIRPPTVPEGSCRIRISLSAAHTFQECDSLVASLRQFAELMK